MIVDEDLAADGPAGVVHQPGIIGHGKSP